MDTDYDILIIGGGMAGASLAIALREIPLRIGVIEAVPVDALEQPSFDVRAIALAQGSKRIFEALGAWAPMVAGGVTPIRKISVSDRGRFGATRLDAREEGVEALGYVVEAAVIGRGLLSRVRELASVEWICPARLTDIEHGPQLARVAVEEGGTTRQYTARLVVAADGGRSAVREILGAKTLKLGYGQTAIISNVITDREHGEIAYERFTETGPLALLPNTAPAGFPDQTCGNRRWSLVWTAKDHQVPEITNLQDNAFLARLQERFGGRAGRFVAASPRAAYPLGLQYVRDHVRERLVFIGNAAHTIHPVAGQGFNLGLRDVAALAEVIAGAVAEGGDPGRLATLQGYADWRRPDYLRVLGMTDGLARTFSNRFAPLAVARNVGMVALDLFPGARHLLARQAMGLVGRQPRLALGLPLKHGLPGAA